MGNDVSTFLVCSFTDAPISTILFGLLFLILWFCIQANRNPANYPPGPFGLPVVGNLLQLGSSPHLSLTELAAEYGPVFSLRLGSRDVVVLSSCDVVQEALGRKANQFAGRPQVYSFQKNSNGGRSVAFSDYGPRQMLHKRCAMKALQTLFKDPARLNNVIHKELERIKASHTSKNGDPFIIQDFLRKEILTLSFRLTFGVLDENNEELKDELYALLKKARNFAENTPSSALLDFMPWLHFALRKEVNFLERTVEGLLAFARKVYKLRKTLDSEKQAWCFAAELENIVKEINAQKSKRQKANVELPMTLDTISQHSAVSQEMRANVNTLMIEDEDKITILTADIFGAGFETVAASLCWALTFLVSNPDIQKDLQDEMDEAIGETSLPSLKDKRNLPLLEATILETLRLRPTLPLALPHCTTEQTSVAGYSLPKGTTVLVNLWGVNHDPSYFHKPEQFNPYRFIDHQTGKIKHGLPLCVLPFSAGARRCIGNTLAKAEMFLFLGGLLKLFKFEAHESAPDTQSKFTFVLMPKLFKVMMSLRKEGKNI